MSPAAVAGGLIGSGLASGNALQRFDLGIDLDQEPVVDGLDFTRVAAVRREEVLSHRI